MASNINLIHTGLPWTSPQKISIHSTQYINNIVINRGLLSLLNNDYYLEIKTQAINNFIENNIGAHINNDDLHVSWKRINSLFSTVNVASRDTIYFIPLYWNNQMLQIQNIQNIISMIPKHLNGHTIVLCFCNGFSQSFKSQYTNEDIKNMIHKEVNLETHNIQINGFTGGDLIIYSTTQPIIINNYNILTELEAREHQVNNIFEDIQACINSTTSFNTSDGITLKGVGLNKNYSILTIKNCQASTYIINIKIYNNLDWKQLDSAKSNIQYLPTKNDLLSFYSLIQQDNGKLLDKSLYLNKNFLYKNNNYSLHFKNGSQTNIKSQTQQSTEKSLHLNSAQYLSAALSPQYFSMDSETSQMLLSQQIRSYIYNWNGNTPHCTIAFWGKLDDIQTNYTNSPIFSDYTFNDKSDFGLYVYLNKSYRTAISSITDVLEYNGDFELYSNKMINKWGLYILEFIHTNEGLDDNITISSFNNVKIQNNYMRINLSFYNLNQNQFLTSADDLSSCILMPNERTIKNCNNKSNQEQKIEEIRKIRYQIPVLTKQEFAQYKYSMNLFANRRIYNADSLKNWDYFSGQLRNLFFFKKILTKQQIQALLKSRQYNEAYHWLSQNQANIIKDINSTNSAIGAIYSINNQNLNIIKTVIETNG